MSAKLRVSKLEAGKRQLETAVILYFNYGDPISIHSLSAAAYATFRALDRGRKRELMLSNLWRFLDTAAAKEFKKLVGRLDNLFKPGSNDPEAVEELDPPITEVLMMDAATKYCEMTGEQPPVLKLYLIWFVSQHPEIFDADPMLDALFSRVRRSRFYKDRHRYFADFLPQVALLFPRSMVDSFGAFPKSPGSKSTPSADQMPIGTFAEHERNLFAQALQSSGGNKALAAKLLRISRKMLYTKIAKYRLSAVPAINQSKNSKRPSSTTRSHSRTRR